MNSRFIQVKGQNRAVPALLGNKVETLTANFAGKATRFLRDQRSTLVKGGERHG
jgi:tripartite-type tricarboxylate transporter receptor subunit TctC